MSNSSTQREASEEVSPPSEKVCKNGPSQPGIAAVEMLPRRPLSTPSCFKLPGHCQPGDSDTLSARMCPLDTAHKRSGAQGSSLSKAPPRTDPYTLDFPPPPSARWAPLQPLEPETNSGACPPWHHLIPGIRAPPPPSLLHRHWPPAEPAAPTHKAINSQTAKKLNSPSFPFQVCFLLLPGRQKELGRILS